MAKKKITQKVREQVKQRAKGYCEYCFYPEAYANQFYSIEHIIPLSKNGTDNLDNLAYACQCCNGHKYNKTHAIDAISGKKVAIFHPRKDNWEKHLCWSDDYLRIEGLSATGRVTVELLDLNRDSLIRLRTVLFAFGEHPPKG